MKFNTIGVIGAGVMGSDIAIDLAIHKLNVILVDKNDDTLEKSKKIISGNLRNYTFINEKFRSIKEEEIISKIDFSSDINKASECDFVIESISENLLEKEELFKKLDKVTRMDVIFASNTSCISITKIAAFTSRPSIVIGIHFMNPVPLKEMTEVVKGYHTSDDTLEDVKSFLKAINKHSVVVNDSPGFVANRLSHLFMNEAAFLVMEGVASPKGIDMIFKKGYGHAMGPLETADLIGLDTVLNSLEILYDSYQDPKFRCCPLLKKMVNAGLLGKKSGEGFYKY